MSQGSRRKHGTKADWRSISGIIHPYEPAARAEVEEAKRVDPDVKYRVARIATGYQAQARVGRGTRR